MQGYMWNFIYNFQTLIAGMLAILGAGATVYIISKQIKLAKDQELERRQRQNFSARAMMPIALDALCDYSQQCITWLLPILNDTQEFLTRDVVPAPPVIPSESIYTLKESIEFGDQSVQEAIADLIRKLQIQQSRLSSIAARFRLPTGTDSLQHAIRIRILDALEIYAGAVNLFDYARRDSDKVNHRLEQFDLMSAANNCEVYELRYPEIFEIIKDKFNP